MAELDDPNQTTSATAGDWYRPGKSCQDFHRSTKMVRCLIGGRGCIHGKTKIFDPVDGTFFSAAERERNGKAFHVISLTPRGLEVRPSSAPFVKGHAPLVSVDLQDGTKWCLEPAHRILTTRGWQRISDTKSGDLVACSSGPPRSISDISRGEFFQDGRNFFQKVADWTRGYFAGCRPGDEQPLTLKEDGLAFFPLQDDVLERIQDDWRQDGRSFLRECIRQSLRFSHLAKIHLFRVFELLQAGGGEDFWQRAEVLPTRPNVCESIQQNSLKATLRQEYLEELGKDQLREDDPILLLQACRKHIRWVSIRSITSVASDLFYDLTVEGVENYWTEGGFHHNSGKTTSVAVEVVGHCWHTPGAKVLLLRKTELSQDETTIDTFGMVYENMGTLYKMTETSLFKTWDDGRIVRLPSAEAVKRYNEFLANSPTKQATMIWLETEGAKWCSWLYFRGIPDEAKRGNKLRGYECSLAVFVEADLMELGDFTLLLPCLRWKDAYGEFVQDVGVIIDTNPPSPRHWIAKLEEGAGKDDMEFWHISTYENEHNLPPRYIERQILLPYKDNPAMIQRMLYGQYAEAFDGQAVLSSFRIGVHVGNDLPFPLHAYLVRGWDFGNVNAVIWSAYWSKIFVGENPEDLITCEYWWDLKELYQTSSDVDEQCKNVLKITNEEFPFWNDRSQCAGILDFCDPAGAAKKDTGSSIAVLNTYGIYPGYKFKDRGIPKTIAIYNRLLGLKDHAGYYSYKIDQKGCPVLFAASTGGYRYPKENEAGFGSGVPLKDGFFDHVCFAPHTRILVERGWIPISEVTTQDRAWTRAGWRQVVKVAQSSPRVKRYRAQFSNGMEFMATGEHPIWSENVQKFIPLLEIKKEDVLRGIASTISLISLEASDIGPVWNMTVDGEHEYFAEGILVSNCDAGRYAKINALRLADMEVEKPLPQVGVLAAKLNVNPMRRY